MRFFLVACVLVAVLFVSWSNATDPQEAWLEENAKKEGVVVLPSGLQYKILKSGPSDGRKPGPANKVECHYRGSTIDGQEFDSSYARKKPATFGVTQVIKGWTEALQLMTYVSVPPLFFSFHHADADLFFTFVFLLDSVLSSFTCLCLFVFFWFLVRAITGSCTSPLLLPTAAVVQVPRLSLVPPSSSSSKSCKSSKKEKLKKQDKTRQKSCFVSNNTMVSQISTRRKWFPHLPLHVLYGWARCLGDGLPFSELVLDVLQRRTP